MTIPGKKIILLKSWDCPNLSLLIFQSKLQPSSISVTRQLPPLCDKWDALRRTKALTYRCYEHGLQASHSWGYCRAQTGFPGGWCGWWEAAGHHTGTDITSPAARCQTLNNISLLCTAERSLKLHFLLISCLDFLFKLRNKEIIMQTVKSFTHKWKYRLSTHAVLNCYSSTYHIKPNLKWRSRILNCHALNKQVLPACVMQNNGSLCVCSLIMVPKRREVLTPVQV